MNIITAIWVLGVVLWKITAWMGIFYFCLGVYQSIKRRSFAPLKEGVWLLLGTLIWPISLAITGIDGLFKFYRLCK